MVQRRNEGKEHGNHLQGAHSMVVHQRNQHYYLRCWVERLYLPSLQHQQLPWAHLRLTRERRLQLLGHAHVLV